MSVGEGILFWVLAPIMIVGAMGLLFAKKAVHAALAMAIVMVGLGVTYFGQEAPFLGGVQIFVYTGAVMMLFVFVIMLVGVDSADSLIETIKGQRVVAALLGLGTAALLIGVISQVTLGAPRGLGEVSGSGNVSAIAAEIFGGYVWAFEVTGALLITAALGAMVLAHRERLVPRPTQRELSVKAHPGRRGQGPAARTRRVRAEQRGRRPGPSAGRHPERTVHLACPHRPWTGHLRVRPVRRDEIGRRRAAEPSRGGDRRGHPRRGHPRRGPDGRDVHGRDVHGRDGHRRDGGGRSHGPRGRSRG